MADKCVALLVCSLLAGFLVEFGAQAVRIDINPAKCYSTTPQKVRISCLPDNDDDQEIKLVELSGNNNEVLAYLSQCDKAFPHRHMSSHLQAVGHIGREVDQRSFLNVTFLSPDRFGKWTYTCFLFRMDKTGNITMQSASGDLLIQKLEIDSIAKTLDETKATIRTLEGKVEGQQKDKVAFTVTNQNITIGNQVGEVLILPEVILQMGEGYDVQQGMFTAPVDGLYFFHLLVNGNRRLCPPEWSLNENNCFRKFQEKKNWTDARDFCIDQQSHLPTILDEKTNKFLAEKINPNDENVWISLNDLEGTTVFKWLTGSDIPTFVKWAKREPNDKGRICAHIWSGQSGGWADYFCSERMKFICQKETAIIDYHDIDMGIYANGKVVARAYAQALISSVVSLAVGDKVFAEMSTKRSNYATMNMHVTFSGYLVNAI